MVTTYKGENIGIVSKEMNEIISDKNIDYAIYNLNNSSMEGLELGDSNEIEIGDKVTVVGYPDYIEEIHHMYTHVKLQAKQNT